MAWRGRVAPRHMKLAGERVVWAAARPSNRIVGNSFSSRLQPRAKGDDSMRLPVLMLVLMVTTGVGTAQSQTHWDYYGKTGPLGWGRLDPAYKLCSDAKEQSPIDIR